MEAVLKTKITIETTVNAPIEKVWESWTEPQHITKWCAASDDWHAPAASNDLRKGGRFSTTMAAKDGSFSFDFGGVYDEVKKHQQIKYTIDDGRTCDITFSASGNEVKIVETFEAEGENPIE